MQTTNQPIRHDENDWLTLLAMAMVFLFHCARFFDTEGWHVKNDDLSTNALLFVGITAQWLMPLFFLLSGMSTCFALATRSASRFLANRAVRLLVPLAFATLVVLIPVQVWIERVTNGQFSGSFLAFYPHYFDGLYAFGGNFAWMGLHLWYLEMLFLFSLLTLPIFKLLSGTLVRRWIGERSNPLANPVGVFLLALLPLAAEYWVNRHLDTIGMRAFGGWSPVTYLAFLVVGFLLALDQRLLAAVEKARFIALPAGLILTTLIFFVPQPGAEHAVSYEVMCVVRTLNAWSLLIAIYGFGRHYLRHHNRVLAYGRDAILPFYVLHQPVIVVTGFALRHWQVNLLFKYLLLASISLTIVGLLYELLIRRVGLLRFLFGQPWHARIQRRSVADVAIPQASGA